MSARDLGGLPAADGRRIRVGALFRSAAPEDFGALALLGIRTVIDLRNDDERAEAPAVRGGIEVLHLALDGVEDREFWDHWSAGPWFGTPEYYRPHLERFPERSARVIRAIAAARPGGILFHCQGGRDRTGMVAMLVLALLGVSAEDICADYVLGCRPDPDIAAYLEAEGVTAAQLLQRTLEELDVAPHLGLSESEVAALRDRLLD